MCWYLFILFEVVCHGALTLIILERCHPALLMLECCALILNSSSSNNVQPVFFLGHYIYIWYIYIIYVYLCLGYPLRYTHHGHQLFATDCFLTTPFAAVVWLSNLPWSSWRVGRRLKLQLAQGVGWWGWIKLFTMGPKSSPTPYVSRFLKLGIYIEKFICWINCVWFNVSHWLRSYNIVAPIHPRRLPRKSLMRSDHGPSQTCATSWWGMPLVILDQEGILNSCKGDGKMFT